MKRMLKRILVVLLVLILLAVAGFGMLYAGRLRTVNSIEQITAYDDYNLYRMDVKYDYSIDDVINYGITDNLRFANGKNTMGRPRRKGYGKSIGFCRRGNLYRNDPKQRNL